MKKTVTVEEFKKYAGKKFRNQMIMMLIGFLVFITLATTLLVDFVNKFANDIFENEMIIFYIFISILGLFIVISIFFVFMILIKYKKNQKKRLEVPTIFYHERVLLRKKDGLVRIPYMTALIIEPGGLLKYSIDRYGPFSTSKENFLLILNKKGFFIRMEEEEATIYSSGYYEIKNFGEFKVIG